MLRICSLCGLNTLNMDFVDQTIAQRERTVPYDGLVTH